MNCGVDQRTLSILVNLVENGVNPEALAAVVKELKRESEALKVSGFGEGDPTDLGGFKLNFLILVNN